MCVMCYWNVVLKLRPVCFENSSVKVTFCLGDIVIFHDTWMYGLMSLRGWTVRKVSQSADLKETFSVLSLTAWWHRSPVWNTQGKNARKYSNRRSLNKILGANFRVFAVTYSNVLFFSQEVIWSCIWCFNVGFIAGNPTQSRSSRLLANFERMVQITLEEKIEAYRCWRSLFLKLCFRAATHSWTLGGRIVSSAHHSGHVMEKEQVWQQRNIWRAVLLDAWHG